MRRFNSLIFSCFRRYNSCEGACRIQYKNYGIKINEEAVPPHQPVLVNEVIENLNLKPGNVCVDMTFGAGGHSLALLEKIPQLKIFALDRDPIAENYAIKLKELYPGQVTFMTGKFTDLPELLKQRNIRQNSIDGILFDLGCSSMQFDNPERGFSVSDNGPLDMRMDSNRVPGSLTAGDIIRHATEYQLAKIFKVYGEERKAKKIARAIEQARYRFKPLQTTHDLCDLIETVCGEVRLNKLRKKAHAATKVFQALRIFVNNELNELNNGLIIAHSYLKVGARGVVISFHSLEDRITKSHFHNQPQEFQQEHSPSELLNCSKAFVQEDYEKYKPKIWEPINKKVILPSEEEVCFNPRSRSAKLRAAAKLGKN